MDNNTVIGVDLGGSNAFVARVRGHEIEDTYLQDISARSTRETVMDELIYSIDQVMSADVKGLGIGVPGLVEHATGMVYDVVNIPSWKEVALKKLLEEKFKRPVFLNNDANCFAMGEYYFGQNQKYSDLVGLIIGTGLGAGIVLDGNIYNGANGGAGEFGMLPYLDHNYEYYASGQFFSHQYGRSGKDLFQKANAGDKEALHIFAEFGFHLGKAIMAIVYALDPEIIILGGSVSKAFPYFEEFMWKSFKEFEYQQALRNLQIKVMSNEYIPVLGAAALVATS